MVMYNSVIEYTSHMAGKAPIKDKDATTRQENKSNAAIFAVMQRDVAALQAENEALKARHVTELLLKESEVKVALQPKLKDAYDQGYAASVQAMKDAREFMRTM